MAKPTLVRQMGRMALGAMVSGALRRAAVQTRKPKRRIRTMTRRRIGLKSRTGSSVRLTRRRKTVRENTSIENRSTGLVQYARKPSAMQLVQSCLEESWNRVQGISKYDTSTGFYPIANRVQSNGAIILPVHFWDITSTINHTPGGTENAAQAGYLFYWTNASTTADAAILALSSQDSNGVTRVGNGTWLRENHGGETFWGTNYPIRKSFHYWTSIKMNLYGCRKRATRFVIQLVQVKDQTADFQFAASTNTEKKKMVQYLAAPFVYSNLQSGDPQTRGDIKILKTYEVTIGPTTTDQYGGQDAAVPHMQTLHWFIHHNRIRRYDWLRHNAVTSATTNAAFDVEAGAGHDSRIDPMKCVYLLVRALSPDQREAGWSDAADPVSEPSYDLIIRNKFGNPG